MQVSKLLDHIESNAIVLPEFQREYVWRKEQAKELMASLYSGYPIGGLLVWETENPPEIKNDAIDRETQRLFDVLLDGQQRLTVLYMLVKDSIPPYYDEDEIQYDPRSLYFNAHSGEFHFETSAIRDSDEWVKVTDIYTGRVSQTDIAEAVAEGEAEQAFDLMKTYDETLGRIKEVLHHDLPVETLPKDADIHQAIELFDKINSQGTHLGEAELALAHMSAQWPHVRRAMKRKQAELKERGFAFDLTFYVKCLIAAVTGGMTYEKAYDVPGNELKEAWEDLAKPNGSLDYVMNVLENQGHIPDSSYINTRDVLVPLVTFVYRNDNRMTEDEKRHFLRWLYAAMMWSRYGGSSDTTLEHDLSLLDGENPTRDLIQEIKDERGRIEVDAGDLTGRGKRSKRFYNMVRIVTRANNPVDWQTGEPLRGSFELELLIALSH